MTEYKTYREYLAHPEFLRVVSQCRKRAGGKCERCGNEKPTEPHHFKYCKWGEFDEPENLQMLCRECHEEAHRCINCGKISLKAKHIKQGLKTCCQKNP